MHHCDKHTLGGIRSYNASLESLPLGRCRHGTYADIDFIFSPAVKILRKLYKAAHCAPRRRQHHLKTRCRKTTQFVTPKPDTEYIPSSAQTYFGSDCGLQGLEHSLRTCGPCLHVSRLKAMICDSACWAVCKSPWRGDRRPPFAGMIIVKS